jgi:threonine/homoserine/homoserine lactone efflux protein
MSVVWHWLVGVIVSYIVAMPIGPVNVAIVQTSLLRGYRSAYSLAVGSAVAELGYCLLAVGGLRLLLSDEHPWTQWVPQLLHIASVPLLIGLGIYYYRKTPKSPVAEPVQALTVSVPDRYRDFGLGFLLNLLNPALFPLWLAISAWLTTQEWIDTQWPHPLIYAAGVGVGTFALHYTVARLAERFQPNLSPHRQKLIQQLVGLFFLGFGVYAILKFWI